MKIKLIFLSFAGMIMAMGCMASSHTTLLYPPNAELHGAHICQLTLATQHYVTADDNQVQPAEHANPFNLKTLFAKGGASKFIRPADSKVITGGKVCRGPPRSTVYLHGDRA